MKRAIVLAGLLGVLLSLFAASAHAQMPTGCTVFKKDHTQPSLTHATTMFEMHLRVSVCFKAGKFTLTGETCWIDHQDPVFVQHSACETSHYHYGWGGNATGGYYAQGSATFKQCFPLIPLLDTKCIGEGTLTLMLWTTANGAHVTDKRVW
jgi:hypothetical protein